MFEILYVSITHLLIRLKNSDKLDCEKNLSNEKKIIKRNLKECEYTSFFFLKLELNFLNYVFNLIFIWKSKYFNFKFYLSAVKLVSKIRKLIKLKKKEKRWVLYSSSSKVTRTVLLNNKAH